MKEKNNHYLINLGKFICALLVVLLHTISNEDKFGYILSVTARIAVPFFFICSGYFLCDKFYENDMNKRREYIYIYIRKIFKMYMLWSIIYMIFDYKFYFGSNNKIKGFIILIRDFIFISTHYHLWYLISLCFAVYILYLLTKRIKFKSIFIISIIIYFFALSGDIYYGIIANTIFGYLMDLYVYIFGPIGNSFAVGLIFMVIGIWIKKYKISYKKNNLFKYLIIAYVLFIMENYILKYFNIPKDNNTSILLLILIPLIFISLLNLEKKGSCNVVKRYSNLLKSLSVTIYIIHPMITNIIHPITLRTLRKFSVYRIDYIEYLLISLICIIIGYIFWRNKNLKYNFFITEKIKK